LRTNVGRQQARAASHAVDDADLTGARKSFDAVGNGRDCHRGPVNAQLQHVPSSSTTLRTISAGHGVEGW
jgi:hypothetical protein